LLLRSCSHNSLGGIKYAENIFNFLSNTKLKIPVDEIGVEKEAAFRKNEIIDAQSFDSTKYF
jgi:hypothetical protein